MTREQIEQGTFFDYEVTVKSDDHEMNALSMLQATSFGIQERFEMLQNTIEIRRSSDLLPFRFIAEFMTPRDPNGNLITTWEAYRDNSPTLLNNYRNSLMATYTNNLLKEKAITHDEWHKNHTIILYNMQQR